MRLIIALALLLFMGCSDNTPYFKITLSDELNPAGFFAEPIEVNNLGKVIYKTHKHNENDNLYQNLFFGELSENQKDSVVLLMSRVKEYPTDFVIDSAKPAFKISITQVESGNKVQRVIVGNQFDENTTQLVKYIQALPDATKRYDLKGNYFFETDNICIEQ